MNVFSFSITMAFIFLLMFYLAWIYIHNRALRIIVQIICGVVFIGAIVWVNVSFNCKATQEIKTYTITSYDPSTSIFAYTNGDEEFFKKLDTRHTPYDNEYSKPTIIEKTKTYLFFKDFRREIHIPEGCSIVIKDFSEKINKRSVNALRPAQ